MKPVGEVASQIPRFLQGHTRTVTHFLNDRDFTRIGQPSLGRARIVFDFVEEWVRAPYIELPLLITRHQRVWMEDRAQSIGAAHSTGLDILQNYLTGPRIASVLSHLKLRVPSAACVQPIVRRRPIFLF